MPVAVVLLGACHTQAPQVAAPASVPDIISPFTTPSTIPTPVSASPTPPAVPSNPRPTGGPPSPTCEHGWVTPPAGSPLHTDPLGSIRRTTGVGGALVVVDMRYFTGPESPPSDKGYLLEIRRWYIKLYAREDLSFQGRFLVEARRFGRGLSAVAPYDTRGWRSPDWRGFQYDSSNPRMRAIGGLPGRWSGVEYDFVRGGAGLEVPGLPDEVVGCLSGT